MPPTPVSIILSFSFCLTYHTIIFYAGGLLSQIHTYIYFGKNAEEITIVEEQFPTAI